MAYELRELQLWHNSQLSSSLIATMNKKLMTGSYCHPLTHWPRNSLLITAPWPKATFKNALIRGLIPDFGVWLNILRVWSSTSLPQILDTPLVCV